ncbi:MAG: LacI family DNA-binding transcriptional regulator [Opitutales bacterium]
MGQRNCRSMREVAEKAGVSVMTVSRALRNDYGVAAATRARVYQAAKAIGYRPNPMLAALMANLRANRAPKSVDVIAFLTSHRERGEWRKSRTFSSFFNGAQERAEQLGFRLEEFWLRQPGMTDPRMSRILRARGISGVIIAPFPNPGAPMELQWENFALATIGYSLSTPILHRTTNHQIHSIRLALKKVTECGYRRIGLVLDSANDQRADHNWVMALLHYQRDVPAKDRIPPLLPDALTPSLVREWLRKWKPDSIIGARMELSDWLHDSGVRVPDDMGYVNIDRYPVMTGVAGIDEKSRAVGASAVNLVVEQLYFNERGIPGEPKVVLIEGAWVDGSTLRPKEMGSETGTLTI